MTIYTEELNTSTQNMKLWNSAIPYEIQKDKIEELHKIKGYKVFGFIGKWEDQTTRI